MVHIVFLVVQVDNHQATDGLQVVQVDKWWAAGGPHSISGGPGGHLVVHLDHVENHCNDCSSKRGTYKFSMKSLSHLVSQNHICIYVHVFTHTNIYHINIHIYIHPYIIHIFYVTTLKIFCLQKMLKKY